MFQNQDIIPPPHLYFSYYLYNSFDLKQSLRSYLSNGFSDEYKQQLSRIWGLLLENDINENYENENYNDNNNDNNVNESLINFISLSLETNPLLHLQYFRWKETIYLFTKIFNQTNISILPTTLSILRSKCLDFSSNSINNNTKSHVSMRLANDPLLPILSKKWFDSLRIWSCHIYSYATPSIESIDKLVNYAPLVEIGAGTGYWAYLIEQRGKQLYQGIKLMFFHYLII